MISYAQNCEDVLLERLFAEVERGFYIDVGAHDPVELSVTKHFSERGWRGINIEPLPAKFARLAQDRPRDVNLPIGLADAPGELTFHECLDNPALSTFIAAQAEEHRRAGSAFRTLSIPVRTLADVVRDHVAGEVDFLSIDVEGFEARVLAGADLASWRPRVVMVESTIPTTAAPSHAEWEPPLLAAGYRFACFDGLNRFYIRAADAALLDRCRAPVNITDRFRRHEQVRLEAALQSREAALQEKEAEIHRQAAARETLEVDLERTHGRFILADATARQLQEQLRDKEQQLLDSARLGRQLAEQLQDKEASLQQRCRDAAALQAQCQEKDHALQRLAATSRCLSDQLTAHAAELRAKEGALHSMTRLAEDLHRQAAALRADLETKHAALQESLDQLRQSQAQCRHSHEQSLDLQARVRQLQELQAEMQLELDELRRPLWRRVLTPSRNVRRPAA